MMEGLPTITVDLSSPGAVADALLRIAELTGDAAYRRAAKVLTQLPPGRQAIDDRLALQDAQAMLDDGHAKSRRAALLMAAKAICRGKNPRHVAERLRRKWKAQKISATE